MPDLLKELGKLGNADMPTKSVINAINICFKPFDGCDFCHQSLGVIDMSVFIVMEDYSGWSHLAGSSKSTYDTENLKSLDHASKTDRKEETVE